MLINLVATSLLIKLVTNTCKVNRQGNNPWIFLVMFISQTTSSWLCTVKYVYSDHSYNHKIASPRHFIISVFYCALVIKLVPNTYLQGLWTRQWRSLLLASESCGSCPRSPCTGNACLGSPLLLFQGRFYKDTVCNLDLFNCQVSIVKCLVFTQLLEFLNICYHTII